MVMIMVMMMVMIKMMMIRCEGRSIVYIDPTTVSGSRRIGDDHNDQDYDDEDGDNDDLHDEAGLTSYANRKRYK